MASIKVRVNDVEHTAEVEPRLLLVHFLRENLRLTGTHIGCETSHCGACTVVMDGKALKSCTVFAIQANGREILTVEGLEQDGKLHPIQEGFFQEHGLQCGFCTPGQIMSAIGLIREGQAGDDPERVREGMSGNLCRCGAYSGITEAVLDAQVIVSLVEADQRRSA